MLNKARREQKAMARVWHNQKRLVAAVLDKLGLRRLGCCPISSSSSSSADLSWRFSVKFSIDNSVPCAVVITDVESDKTTASEPLDIEIKSNTFTFHELSVATRNFDHNCLIDKRDFGKLYKGQLMGSKQVVAIRKLNGNGVQANREFFFEVSTLSLLHHPNLVNLIGYCAHGYHRLLVYEYYPLGSLYNHLHEPMPGTKHLDWNKRMKIAAGIAKGLEYFHHNVNPPVILRHQKPCNILLDEGYNPKISNVGFAKISRFMGPFGYCAPEYPMTGCVTMKSDVYSFGVILLELISGRKAVDVSENGRVQTIVEWVTPFFQDEEKMMQIVDPALQGQYQLKTMNRMAIVAAMCVQWKADLRPTMVDFTKALTYLSSQK